MRPEEKLIVAAATFNRPKGLSLLLEEMANLRFLGPVPKIEMVVVDNSPDANARTLVQERARVFPWPLHYLHQSERGIAAARNLALEAGLSLEGQWLAFIDDDEYPAPTWLDRMITMAREAKADVVVGTVEPRFDTVPARWMVNGGFFAIDRFQEGEILDFGNTSNVLFDMRFVRENGLRFDPAFGLTGGEDTYFFEHVQAAGGRIVFSQQGVVYETIVAHRAKLAWLVQRWCRSGNTDGRILLRVQPGMRSRILTVLIGGSVRLFVGGGLMLVKSPLALFGKAHIPAEHLRVASRGVGFIMSAFGRDIEEYRTLNR